MVREKIFYKLYFVRFLPRKKFRYNLNQSHEREVQDENKFFILTRTAQYRNIVPKLGNQEISSNK